MIVEMHGGKMGYIDARDEPVTLPPPVPRQRDGSSFPNPNGGSFPSSGMFGASYPPLVGAVEKIAEAVNKDNKKKTVVRPNGAIFFVELPVHYLNPEHQEYGKVIFPRGGKVGVASSGLIDRMSQVAESLESGASVSGASNGSGSSALPIGPYESPQNGYLVGGSKYQSQSPSQQSPSSPTQDGVFVNGSNELPRGGGLYPTSAYTGVPSIGTELNSYGQPLPHGFDSHGNMSSEYGSHTKVSDPIPIPW